MKKSYMLFVLCCLIIPFNVFGADYNTKVGSELSKAECTRDVKNGGFQDWNVSTEGVAYFSHCMKATCETSLFNYNYEIEYYTDERVNCLNGNSDPYYEMAKNGCSDYEKNSCGDNPKAIKYCSVLIKYDCSRKSNGSLFNTTTKKTTTKRRVTTKKSTTNTTTPTTARVINTKLQSLTLSEGSVMFNSDVFEYSLKVNESVNSINVTAIPIESDCRVEVLNNTNLVNGSVITINVIGTDNSYSVYKINVVKDVVKSNNTRLGHLEVVGFDIQFEPAIKNYTVILNNEVNALDIKYVPEDDKSTVSVQNNTNIVNGSKVTISVTAEDGSVNYYNIDVFVKKKSNFLKILFIFILILAILAGGYYVYKKFIASKAGDKYEYE